MAETPEHTVDPSIGDQQALEAFVVENDELEALEGLVEQFNIFEAVGVVRQELRHSDFLAFLLDPRQNHRLGDVFVRRLLQRILIAARDFAQPVSPVHLDSWDLGQLEVRREWRNIDILLVDHANRVVILIENKIDSTEHSDQLRRYARVVTAEYPPPRWQHVAVYLTPNGEAPLEAEYLPAYLPADYGQVADAVEAVAESRKPVLDPSVYELMVHYSRMLRRHIVSDSEIAELCRGIYQRHKRALDLIFEHRPDRLAEVQAILLDLVASQDDLILDTASKQVVRFGDKAWEGLPKGKGWTHSGWMVLFQFENSADRLDLSLVVGPGTLAVRQHLIDLATHHQPPYKVPKGGIRKNHKMIYSRRFLRPEDYLDVSLADLEARIRDQWDEFVTRDLPALVPPIQEAKRAFEASSVNVKAISPPAV